MVQVVVENKILFTKVMLNNNFDVPLFFVQENNFNHPCIYQQIERISFRKRPVSISKIRKWGEKTEDAQFLKKSILRH